MGELKRVNQEIYIENLFRNLAKQKEIPVTTCYGGKQAEAKMAFNARRGNEPTLKFEKDITDFHSENEVEIQFVYKDVFFLFRSRVTSVIGDTCQLEKPAEVFSTLQNETVYPELRPLSIPVSGKSVPFFGLAHPQNGEPTAYGFVVRIYDGTFLGQHVISVPNTKMNPEANVDVYSGLADYMLSHPDFKYYINYVNTELDWHQEVFLSMGEIINNNAIYAYDTLQHFECNLRAFDEVLQAAAPGTFVVDGFKCEAMNQPDAFIKHCIASLTSLEIEGYSYNDSQFDLGEVGQAYSAMAFSPSRGLWHISKDGSVCAYAVAEAYPDELTEINLVDNCRLFIVNNGTDIEQVLEALMPEMIRFYEKNGKASFNVLLKADEKIARDICVSGLEYKSEIGRVIMNQPGLVEYKKLLMDNFLRLNRYYTLTHPQMGIWYTEKVYPGTSFGNISSSVRIKDAIDFSLLESAIKMAVEKNDGIRMRIVEIDGEPGQYLSKYKSFGVEFFDFSQPGEAGFNEWCEEVNAVPFHLIDSDLFYFACFKLSASEGGFYIKTHHIITDGWSVISLLISKIVENYSMLKKGIEISTTRKPSYIDFIVSEQSFIDSNLFYKQKSYWDEKFKTLPEFTSFKPSGHSYGSTEAKRKTFVLTKELTAKINHYCEAEKVSPFTVFLSTLYIYLNRITAKEDIVIGTPVLNRSHAKEKEMVGMFISMVPLRIKVNPALTFGVFTAALSKELMAAFKNQKYPYDLILKDYRERHNTNDNIFDVVLSFQNFKLEKAELTGEYDVKWHFNGRQTESLQIHISDRGDEGQYTFELDYLIDVLEEDEVNQIYSCIINLLSEAVGSSEKQLRNLQLISNEEREKLLFAFNNTRTDYPSNKTIHRLFEEQVERTPDNIALIFGNGQLTYKELNDKANRLAHLLRAKGLHPDSVVGLMVNRSFDMMIGIFGILKAGGAYLPIDPDYPADRINYMLENSNTRILVSQNNINNSIEFDGEVIYLDDESIYPTEEGNLVEIAKPNDLAYVIYTSGSTGMPKGVMIEHRSVVNYIKGITDRIDFLSNYTILALTTISFDIFVLETLLSLSKGLRVVIADEEQQRNPSLLEKLILEKNIDMLQMTPSRMQILITHDSRLKCLKNIKTIMITGEAFPPALLECLKVLHHVKIYNMYGPTETTVHSIIKDLTGFSYVLIGKPIANTQIFIIDDSNNLLPIGNIGELCIAGDGLARGYLNKPELTSEKFIANPFIPEKKLYKTGDLARWLPDGDIECLGRIDNQVKIRGFRVELGEIEYQLKRHERVKEAVVYAKEDVNENKVLCAYLVSDRMPSNTELREFLSKAVPDYMIPSYFIKLDKLPLTSNGKIDRNALPKPGIREIQTEREYKAPSNLVEEKLARICKAVLDADEIGMEDNFFEFGGDSLSAITVMTRIQKEMGKDISIRNIFEAKSLKELAEVIRSLDKAKYPPIKIAEQKEYYPVSSSQKRMFVINQLDSGSTNYNMSGKIIFDGILDKKRLEECIRELIKRHESLRTSFHLINGEIVQKVHSDVQLNIKYFECAENVLRNKIADFIQPFQMDKAPLLRAKVVKLSEHKHAMLIDMHHIISDGASIGIIINDLMKLYNGEELRELKVQYKDFAVWQTEFLESEILSKQEKYWLNVFNGETPILNLTTDFNRPTFKSFKGDRVSFKTNKEISKGLTRLAKDTETTLFMLLIAAYKALLYKYTNQEDIIVGTPIAGRISADVNSVVGMFINTLALRSKPHKDKIFKVFLSEIKDIAIGAFENQEYQFEELVNKLCLPRDISRNPLFDTMFILQDKNAYAYEDNNLTVTVSELDSNIAKFDITIQAMEIDKEIVFTLDYCTDLFRKETMERFSEHYVNVLESIVNKPECTIGDIDMLSIKEKDKILFEFNDTDTNPSYLNKTIHESFEEVAERLPNQIALVHRGVALTYKELNSRANRLAAYLRKKGIKSEKIVGIMLDRSIEMIVGIIAILKAGGVYLPLDVQYPEDRISYMLEDSKAVLLLTNNEYKNNINYKIDLLITDDELQLDEEVQPVENMSLPTHLAYIIYTSGSTGKPKGVMVEHKGVSNLSVLFEKDFKINPGDRILQFASSSFDASVWEIFMGLHSGASLYIAPRDVIDNYESFAEFINSNGITIATLPPTYLTNLVPSRVKTLRLLIAAGSATSQELFNKWKNHVRYINAYGPTETTVCATVWNDEKSDELNCIPIGKPIPNAKVYVFDSGSHLQAIGIPGEICIAGDILARGYLGKSELTEEKFVADPFRTKEKMYKTGDLGRWLPDGNLEFLGRMDNQVKVRGYRIELGEIESIIRGFESVKDIAVIDREISGNVYICAYIVFKEKQLLKELRNQLVEKLPEFMVPSYLVELDEIPLNISGKIDRKLLPDPRMNLYQNREYETPRNKVDEILIKIWEGVLELDHISISDNFFELGADSMSIIKVLTKLLPWKWKVSMQDFYIYQTTRELSDNICKISSNEIALTKESTDIVIRRIKDDINNIYVSGSRLDVKNVLLTGGTGFLGAHILETLIQCADTNVFCLVRGKDDDDAKHRFVKTMAFYFGYEFMDLLDKRIFILRGDVAEKGFGLSESKYSSLGKNIDLVIHTAANVRHFGKYEAFEKINVSGTENIVVFCKTYGVKLSHISTTSVSGSRIDKNMGEKQIFTENDLYINQNFDDNVYVKSKFMAENLIFKAVNSGLNASVFRVGNLTGRYKDGHFQSNAHENRFYNILKSIVMLGAVSSDVEDMPVEFTPVDLCSRAIVQLSVLVESEGKAFHLFNHNLIKMKIVLEVFNEYGFGVKSLDKKSFLEHINMALKDGDKNDAFMGIINDLDLADGKMLNYESNIMLSSDITLKYLDQIGFEWPIVSIDYLRKIVGYLKRIGFVDKKS